MEFFIYSAGINGELVINISSNPRIDFTILHNIYDIKYIEVLTPALNISQADYIMRALNRKNGFLKRFAMRSSSKYGNLKISIMRRLLLRLGVNPLRKTMIIDKVEALPGDSDLKTMDDILEGRILTLDMISNIIEKNGLYIVSPIEDILQSMYMKDKLNIYPSIVIDEPYRQTHCRICGGSIEKMDCSLKCTVCGSTAESREPLFALVYRKINAAIGPTAYRECRGMSAAQCDASARLDRFLKGGRDECLLWTRPGAENIGITANTIKDILYRGGRCACLTPCMEDSIKSYDRLKNIFPKSGCTIFKSGDAAAAGDIVICSFDDIKEFYRSFDLVIINEYPGHNKKFPDYLLSPARESLSGGGKIIYATSAPSFNLYKRALKNDVTLVAVPVRNPGKPSPEPRVVTYKISGSGNSFIPREIIEFIVWSIRNNIPVHIVVPAPDYAETLEGGLILSSRIRRDWLEGQNKRIDITTLKDINLHRTGGNVLVYFADVNSVFDEKALLDAAGLSGEGDYGPGEVIFVGSKENDEMYNARMMLRFINKKAWEMGYLR